jgi:EmrB/QacA subfamily drug resistance transporter
MRAILIYIVIHLIVLLTAISGTAVSVAFPNIISHYNTSLVIAGWVLSIYQLVAACSMVLMGKISDVLGRKTTFLICAGLFMIGSLIAALAPNIWILIAARFIQSIGGGGLIPAVIGMIVELFPQKRAQAIGISMSIISIGGIVGPNYGGWLTTTFGWQAIFWVNVPIIILAVTPLFFLLKSEARNRMPIDYSGAALFSAFLFSFMIGLSQIVHSNSTFSWTMTGLLFAASIVFILIFIRHELRTKDPIVELDLLRLKPFAAANIYNLFYGACIFGFSSFIPLYAVSVYHMTTIESGYALMARSLGMIVATTLSGFFVVQWGYRKPMLAGSIISSFSLILCGMEFAGIHIFGAQFGPIVIVSVLSLIMGIGMGVAGPASGNACLDLRPESASTISGVRGMFRQSGGAVSIAIITMILQYIGNQAIGFRIVFIAIGILTLVTIPFIYAMPERGQN